MPAPKQKPIEVSAFVDSEDDFDIESDPRKKEDYQRSQWSLNAG